MDCLRLFVALVLSFSVTVLAANHEGENLSPLPPVLQVFQPSLPGRENTPGRQTRVKRQNGIIIDSIFQIPIQTLSAVNNLFKNSVLAFQSWRQQGAGPVNQSTGTGTNFQTSATSALQYTGSNFGSNNFGASSFNGGNGYYSNNYYRPPRKYQSIAAMRGDLPVKGDGSSYRI